MKSGFIAILGKPNVGKSTLLNTLVGQKVAIVSWRPQTTRNRITGIVNSLYDGESIQAIFIDTPGIHQGKSKLSQYMKDSILSASYGVDIIVYVLDGEKEIHKEDLDNIEKFGQNVNKIIVAVNKMDIAPKELMVANLTRLNDLNNVIVIPISAKKGENVTVLFDEISKNLKDGVKYYPDDMITDRPLRFMAAELIREKALIFLQEEIPHGLGIDILKYDVREDGLVKIEADIICERNNHKGIIIGKKGEMLKRIATSARKELEILIGSKVFLRLWVKVKPDWKDNNFLLTTLGYNIRKE